MSRLLPELYDARFDEREVSAKDAVWREIVAFLQRFVDPEAPILDLACDRGHFIRWVRGNERWGTDIRDMRAALPDDIRFVQARFNQRTVHGEMLITGQALGLSLLHHLTEKFTRYVTF